MSENNSHEQKPNPPVFGIDTPKSIKPPTEAEIKALGEHGDTKKIRGSTATPDEFGELRLEIQNVPSTSEGDSEKKFGSQPNIYSTETNPTKETKTTFSSGSEMSIREGFVLYDEDGNEIGVAEDRVNNAILQRVIRKDKNKAPLFELIDPSGKKYYIKKIGTTWVSVGNK